MSTSLSSLPGYDFVRYRVVPPLFLAVITPLAQILVRLGNPASQIPIFNLGSVFAWKVVLSFYLWAFLSLKVPSKQFLGPKSPEGEVPRYAANGTQFYLVSLAAYFALVWHLPWLPSAIYDDFGHIVSCLSLSALALCLYLMVVGLSELEEKDEAKNFPWAYNFYRGVQLHPRIGGVDVKQWSNCRVGMLGWALLVITFALAGAQRNPPSTVAGAAVNALLINIYLCKFFYWETGYFNTLDITLDRAGYYLCWGCLVAVQTLYTFSGYFLVAHPSRLSRAEAAGVLAFGLAAILLNYAVDAQKEAFRTTGGKCHIWGRPAKFLAVEYTDESGKVRKSRLLTSGFWGVSRHLNYVFELMVALSWSLPSARSLPVAWPGFIYVPFLFILLVHRIFRDEDKCRAKYGKGWDLYCGHVRYRLIPGIF